MKLSDILHDFTAYDFQRDHKIIKLPIDLSLFNVYYVCELGGLLFKHDNVGIIYTEVLEPSSALSQADIAKIEDCLNEHSFCQGCKKEGSPDCHLSS